jgi:hypothetical protein
MVEMIPKGNTDTKELENIFLTKLLSHKEVFIFVATPMSMKNRDRLYHCAVAAKYHKTMYACVKDGFISRIYWRRFRDFPWKRVYVFRTKQDLDYAIHDILILTRKDAKRLTKRKKEDDIAYA